MSISAPYCWKQAASLRRLTCCTRGVGRELLAAFLKCARTGFGTSLSRRERHHLICRRFAIKIANGAYLFSDISRGARNKLLPAAGTLCASKRPVAMPVERHDTNARMSQSVKAGNTIYIAGQLGYETRYRSVEDQMREVLERIASLLKRFGASPANLVSATVWLNDIRDYDKINQIWDAWIPQGHAPARACVEAKLAFGGCLVEIAAVAALE